MAGVTLAGFEAKTTEDLVTELGAAIQAQLGASLDLSASSVLGQLIGIFADRYTELWELAEVIANATNPDAATGAALEALCALTGVVREGATSSTAVVTLGGDPGTALPSGMVVSTSGGGTRFSIASPLSLSAAPAWAGATLYGVGATVTRGGNLYYCVVGGTSGAGPTGTGSAIVDGTVTWSYVGTGTAFNTATWTAQDTGPLPALAGTLTVIETPVAGWTSSFNRLDAELGRNAETDAELRLRREAELHGSAFAALEAIRAHLLQVAGVTAVTVFENVTDSTDVDGLPPHSVEAMVQGGTDGDVRDAVFASVAAGIATHGLVSGVVTDSQGIDHTIKFSRPDEIEIEIILNVDVDADAYPADGDAQLQALLGSIVSRTGLDVRSSALSARAFEVSGVLGAVALIAVSPTTPTMTTTIPIGIRELATFDSSRVAVNSTPVTP